MLQVCQVFGFGQNGFMSTDQDKLDEQKRIFGIAYAIAESAHAGDFRDLPDARPYLEHVKDVAAFFPDWETKTVAILHDTIEDTRKKKPGIKVTEETLREAEIPEYIIAGVAAMTKPPKSDQQKSAEELDPALKLDNYLNYVKDTVKRNALARKVKIADNYVNMRDLIAQEALDEAAQEQLNKYAQSIAILTAKSKPSK
jgi:(p)ppGpp synthase/HD superfamily hydrolase